MNLVQFQAPRRRRRHHLHPAHIAMVEPSSVVGDGNGTDVVVAAPAGLALVRVSGPIKKPAGRTAG